MLINSKVKTNIHYVLSNSSIDEAITLLEQNKFSKGINAIIFLLHKPVGLGQSENVLSYHDPRLQHFFQLVDHNNYDFKIGFDSCSIPAILNFTSNLSKDFIDTFNAIIATGGNIDWGLVSHPYPVPLTWAAYWTGGAYYKNLVKHNVATAYMTMENIEVMTDYMCSPQLLAPNGEVRSILLIEVGYTTTQGDDYACAAMVLGYQQAANNQHIDGMIMSGQTDHPVELAQGLAFGLSNVDGSHKGTYECFKQLDGPNAQAYIQNALALRGVSDLGQVVYPR